MKSKKSLLKYFNTIYQVLKYLDTKIFQNIYQIFKTSITKKMIPNVIKINTTFDKHIFLVQFKILLTTSFDANQERKN